jgi:hypothetical protein
LVERPRSGRELLLKTRTLGIPTAKTTRKRIVDKDDKMFDSKASY